MIDAYGDGWNGGSASFADALGNSLGTGTLTAGDFWHCTISISAYSMDPIVVAGDFTCVASAEGNDGNGNCTLFDADDVDVSFISEEGVLYYVYVGSTGAAWYVRLDLRLRSSRGRLHQRSRLRLQP